jgi:hypothetical protein
LATAPYLIFFLVCSRKEYKIKMYRCRHFIRNFICFIWFSFFLLLWVVSFSLHRIYVFLCRFTKSYNFFLLFHFLFLDSAFNFSSGQSETDSMGFVVLLGVFLFLRVLILYTQVLTYFLLICCTIFRKARKRNKFKREIRS